MPTKHKKDINRTLIFSSFPYSTNPKKDSKRKKEEKCSRLYCRHFPVKSATGSLRSKKEIIDALRLCSIIGGANPSSLGTSKQVDRVFCFIYAKKEQVQKLSFDVVYVPGSVSFRLVLNLRRRVSEFVSTVEWRMGNLIFRR